MILKVAMVINHYLLESFVDEEWAGTCYQADNGQKIGNTKGRGRQDKHNKQSLSRQAIYVYAVDNEFRQKIGLPMNAGLGALKLTDGLDGNQWAEHEFGGAP